ncbi:MAG: hypothetical protein HWN81_10190 [Candidatus Lokiarchaeota archaeon]|nr:hypothetical protein [Candidatus Lokiarchaeota archaeon]
MSKFKVINLEKDNNSKWEETTEGTLVAIINNSIFIDDSYYEAVNKVMEDDNKSMLTVDISFENDFGAFYIQRLENQYVEPFPYFIKKSEYINPFNPNILDQIKNNQQGKLIEHLSEPVFKHVKKIH